MTLSPTNRSGKARGSFACSNCFYLSLRRLHTDKKKFRMEQLQSHLWLTASSYMGKYLDISSYIRKAFLIYDFATAPLWIFLIYEENLIFFFISVEEGEGVDSALWLSLAPWRKESMEKEILRLAGPCSWIKDWNTVGGNQVLWLLAPHTCRSGVPSTKYLRTYM